eukprot:TRINITY_DN2827_c0_g1_i1.p1 TRINITY_DN2827_c0_g1~~TRINITY_DN2827_c0_g1_i1.p1  ORF type:complete len:738 (+),score=133.78 TRINITY_DN2827_c0_g1_i1:49-2214(+)
MTSTQPPLPDSPPPVPPKDTVGKGVRLPEDDPYPLPVSVKMSGELARYYAPNLKYGASGKCRIGRKPEVVRDVMLTSTELNLCLKGEPKTIVRVKDVTGVTVNDSTGTSVVVHSNGEEQIALEMPASKPGFLEVFQMVAAAMHRKELPIVSAQGHVLDNTVPQLALDTPLSDTLKTKLENSFSATSASEVISENFIRSMGNTTSTVADTTVTTARRSDSSGSKHPVAGEKKQNVQTGKKHSKKQQSNSTNTTTAAAASPHHEEPAAYPTFPQSRGFENSVSAIPVLKCSDCQADVIEGQNYCGRCGTALRKGSSATPLLTKLAVLKDRMADMGVSQATTAACHPEHLEGLSPDERNRLIEHQRLAIASLKNYIEQQALQTVDHTMRLDELQAALVDDLSSVSDTTLMLGGSSDSSDSSDGCLYVRDPLKPDKEYPSANHEQMEELQYLRMEVEQMTSGTYVEYLQKKTANLEKNLVKMKKWGKRKRDKERERNKALREWAELQTRRPPPPLPVEDPPVPFTITGYRESSLQSEGTTSTGASDLCLSKKSSRPLKKPDVLVKNAMQLQYYAGPMPNEAGDTSLTHGETIKKGLFVPLTSSIMRLKPPLVASAAPLKSILKSPMPPPAQLQQQQQQPTIVSSHVTASFSGNPHSPANSSVSSGGGGGGGGGEDPPNCKHYSPNPASTRYFSPPDVPQPVEERRLSRSQSSYGCLKCKDVVSGH